MSVNEIDVNAVNEKNRVIKLLDLPRNSRIKAETKDVDGNIMGDFIIFHHVDGMYSYCTVEGKPDKACHLGVFTELKKTGDYYEFA